MNSPANLEESILFALYQNKTLKKNIVTISNLKVKLDAAATDVSVQTFELELTDQKDNSLVFNSKKQELFVDEIRTVLRDEIEEEDWEFLEMELERLRESLPQVLSSVKEAVEKHYKLKYADDPFLPYGIFYDFLEDEEEFDFHSDNPVEKWTRAWQRMVKIKRNYLIFVGFQKEQLSLLSNMQFYNLTEYFSSSEHADEITEIGFTLKDDVVEQNFKFFRSEKFETKIHLDAVLTFEPWDELQTYLPVVQGLSLAEVFGLPEEHAGKINTVIKEFIFSNIDAFYDAVDEFEVFHYENSAQ